MNRKTLVALFHALSGASCLIVSLLTRGQLRIPQQPIKTVGYLIFTAGLVLYGYTLLYLREGFRGNIDPVTESLVVDGPYRWARHPLYLAMLAMVCGLALGMRSMSGLALTVLAFLPATFWRARLEEEALSARFGSQWQEYVSRTRFMLPLLF